MGRRGGNHPACLPQRSWPPGTLSPEPPQRLASGLSVYLFLSYEVAGKQQASLVHFGICGWSQTGSALECWNILEGHRPGLLQNSILQAAQISVVKGGGWCVVHTIGNQYPS